MPLVSYKFSVQNLIFLAYLVEVKVLGLLFRFSLNFTRLLQGIVWYHHEICRSGLPHHNFKFSVKQGTQLVQHIYITYERNGQKNPNLISC